MNNVSMTQISMLSFFCQMSRLLFNERVCDSFDLVRWPCGLHGSRLLSTGNLSHHLPVCGLPGPPGHHPRDTDVLCTEQPTDFQ